MTMDIQTLIDTLEKIKILEGENVKCIVHSRVGVDIITHLDRPKEVFIDFTR